MRAGAFFASGNKFLLRGAAPSRSDLDPPMPRARKLFPSYGSALASRMLSALERGRVVEGFVSAYVAGQDRRGILGGPARDRELAETIGREVMLAMIHEARRVLPRFFGNKPRAALRQEETAAIEAFFQELFATLGRAWQWDREDRKRFGSDLALYSEFAARRSKAAASRKQETPRQEDPPFVGRVALLLDPSMLEQARRATRQFHADVERLARKLLRQTVAPRQS
jgi:hypothetical protein